MGRAWNCDWHTELVFSLTRPTAAVIEQKIEAARSLPLDVVPLLSVNGWLPSGRLPLRFAHDRSRSFLGEGEAKFSAAKRALARWVPFDLGWVRVTNTNASVVPGQVVAVEAHTLGLWTINLSRITETIDTAQRFGFIYATTAMHVEQGEERFLLEFDGRTGEVWYDIEAISRPRSTLARLGFPFTRAFQHRFARDSHRRMKTEILA
jgi:uncharacterized protein (UPF0548 family)